MSNLPEPMTGDEFRAAMDLLATTCSMLASLDLDRLMGMVERVEVLGPLFEPTAYVRGGSDNLRDQAELLRAAAGVRTAVARIRTRAERRTAR